MITVSVRTRPELAAPQPETTIMKPAGRRLAAWGDGRQAGVVPTLRSPVLVGRGAELATALGLIDATARGRGGVLLVTGEAGIGKSRLVDEVCVRAGAAGMTVLVGRSVAGGGTYRAVTEALARLLRGQPRLDDPASQPYRAALRRLLPGVPDGEPLPSAPDPTVMLGEGVLAVLDGRRALLVLEDLHWADPDTLDLVRYLAGALVDAPVLLVATARDDAAQPGVARLAAEVPTLALHRLDADGVVALAAACRGAPLATIERDELVARADGLPLLVEELLAVGPTGMPPSLAALVAGRLAALAPSARRVVLAAAVVGDPDWRLLAAITAPARPALTEAGMPGAAVPGPATSGAVPGPATSGAVPGPATSGAVPGPATSGAVPGPATSGAVPGPATSGAVPGPATSGAVPGPATSGAVPGPATSGAVPGPATSGAVPGPATSGAVPGPATPDPATPGPATSSPATPDPATSSPATHDPATSSPATPDPATSSPATTGATSDPATTGRASARARSA